MSSILLVAHAFPPTFGGVETHLWDLSHQLAARGHEVACLVGGEPAREAAGPVSIARYPELSVAHLTRARRHLDLATVNHDLLDRLKEILGAEARRYAPDLVHLHNAHHFAPELALSCFDTMRGRDIPLLNSVHDRVGEHLYPDVLGYGWSHTIFASRYLRESLPPVAHPASTLWLGIDLGLFSPAGDADPRFSCLEPPVVFHPARLLRWKGVTVSAAAFLILRERWGAGTLVFCDSENIVDDPGEVARLRREVEGMVRNTAAEGHLAFLSFARAQMPGAYRASDLVWYPTTDEEPLGLAPLEAMACGTPLVVSDSGGMRETVLPGHSGLVVPKRDAHALADASARLLDDAVLRARLTAQAVRHAQQFDIRHYTTAIESIYASTILA